MVVILFEGGEAMTSLPWSSTTNPAGGFGSGASLNPSPLSSSSSSFTTSTLEKSKPLLLLFFFFLVLVLVLVLVLLFGPVGGLGAALQRVRLRRRVWRLGIWRANWGKGKKERFEERGVGDGDGAVKIEGEEQYMVLFGLSFSLVALQCVFCWFGISWESENLNESIKLCLGFGGTNYIYICLQIWIDTAQCRGLDFLFLFFMLKDSLLLFLILGKS